MSQQQLGHADHAVERRADLVAHVGQELGLRRATPRRASASARLRSVMSVRDRADRVDAAVVVAQRELDDQRASGVATSRSYSITVPGARISTSVARARSATSGANSSASVRPIRRSRPDHASSAARVDEQVAAFAVLDGDPRGRVLEDALQAVVGDAQRLGGAPALGDVGAGRDQVLDPAALAEQARHGPGDEPLLAAGGGKRVLVVAREVGRAHVRARRRSPLGGDEGFDQRTPDHVVGEVAGDLLGGAVEALDPAGAVGHDHEAPRGLEDRAGEVALAHQLGLGARLLAQQALDHQARQRRHGEDEQRAARRARRVAHAADQRPRQQQHEDGRGDRDEQLPQRAVQRQPHDGQDHERVEAGRAGPGSPAASGR